MYFACRHHRDRIAQRFVSLRCTPIDQARRPPSAGVVQAGDSQAPSYLASIVVVPSHSAPGGFCRKAAIRSPQKR